uniref:MICOS complex subunit n=1 Tax=Panagrolaimus sp. JU765 TaxID=591449 RepID=A0AC34QTK6_9BILA
MVMEDTEPYINKITNFAKNWFTVSTTKTSDLKEKELVQIKDLPYYPDKPKVTEYQFVEKEKLPLEHEFTAIRYAVRDGYEIIANRFGILDKSLTKAKDAVVVTEYQFVEKEKLPLEHEFTAIRYAVRDGYEIIANRFGILDKSLTKAKDAVVAADDYVRNEWTVLPKAMAITIGGMAGFVLGIKRYGIRKFVYAAGGLTTMAAFCYPNETVDIVRIGVLHAQRTWDDFKKSPETKK